jgi:molybdopterin converting factor subunit 1
MKIHLLAYGIAKEIIGNQSITIEFPENSTVEDVKNKLISSYPSFGKLVTFAIAVNTEYASDKQILSENDEVAIIPPVSGG